MPSKFFADLHIHSTASDGTYTPAEVVEHAANVDLKAISLTDHDTVAGVDNALREGAARQVEVIPGIEMGSDVGGRDIHILGYFIDYRDSVFLKVLINLQAERLVRAREMCEKLSEKGLPLDVDDAEKLAPGGVLTRAHIARAVVEKGYAGSVNEVFQRYLGNGKSCFVPKYNETADDVISIITAAGGLPVLAHPKLSAVDNLVESLVASGLRGIEAYCLDHKPDDIRRYLRLADKFGLLVTGGSDCHGPRTPGRFLMGKSGVGEKRVAALRKAAENRQA